MLRPPCTCSPSGGEMEWVLEFILRGGGGGVGKGVNIYLTD